MLILLDSCFRIENNSKFEEKAFAFSLELSALS